MKELDFGKQLHYDLWKEAGRSMEKANPLEKEMLEQHRLLREITFIPYQLHDTKFDPWVDVEGTAQGLQSIDIMTQVFSEARKTGFAGSCGISIPTGKMGVSKDQFEKTHRPGINAKVMAEIISQYGDKGKEV
jgi:hypothetical protein